MIESLPQRIKMECPVFLSTSFQTHATCCSTLTTVNKTMKKASCAQAKSLTGQS